MNKKHKERGRRIDIVRRFCDGLSDERQRTICMLFSKKVPESRNCKLAGINKKTLELIKLLIAVGLRQAGV